MGVNIFINIVKNKEIIKKNIYDGRCSEWFRNLRGEGWDDIYDKLPIYSYNFDENIVPANLIEKYKEDYYDHRMMNVGDFKTWFNNYRPDLDAGWVTTYEKWKMEKKAWTPYDIPRTLPEDAKIEDYHFVEFINDDDQSKWLYNYLITENIPDDAYIIYCFG